MTGTTVTARPERLEDVARIGGPHQVLADDQMRAFVHEQLTGAKRFYKVEPIVADGGQVVLSAPHSHDVSVMHPHIVDIGYHCRDYVLKQWPRFASYRWGDLAHSTHLCGAGDYDDVSGERDRVTVTLATGIPKDVVRSINGDYLDPAEVDVEAWSSDPDTLVVPEAGEVLFRLS